MNIIVSLCIQADVTMGKNIVNEHTNESHFYDLLINCISYSLGTSTVPDKEVEESERIIQPSQ